LPPADPPWPPPGGEPPVAAARDATEVARPLCDAERKPWVADGSLEQLSVMRPPSAESWQLNCCPRCAAIV
jgi:hypothetical protein